MAISQSNQIYFSMNRTHTQHTYVGLLVVLWHRAGSRTFIYFIYIKVCYTLRRLCEYVCLCVNWILLYHGDTTNSLMEKPKNGTKNKNTREWTLRMEQKVNVLWHYSGTQMQNFTQKTPIKRPRNIFRVWCGCIYVSCLSNLSAAHIYSYRL